MSVRAIKARLVCDQKTLDQLWRTHVVFNERLPTVIRTLFKMRRGEFGSTPQLRRLYRDIALYITNYSSQQAEYLLNAISNKKPWTPNTARKRFKPVKVRDNGAEREIAVSDWVDQATELSARCELVFDKDQLHGDLPGCMRQMISREAVAIISGHDKQTNDWHEDHEKWRKEKAAWEADDEHKKYLAVKPLFDAFEESVGGKIRQRRGRWHKYLDFLRANPQLAAWRGGEPKVTDLDDAARQRVGKARRRKQRSVEAEEFWSRNEELRALDRLHGEYEKKFMRRGKRKRNPDGFRHHPTFTEPHPTLHPRWFVFNAPQTNPSGWRNLRIPARPCEMGALDLLVLSGEKTDGEYPSSWVTLQFKADPRLCDFRATTVKTKAIKGKNKGQEVEKPAFLWHDRQLQRDDRPATIGGVKLMFKLRADGTPSAAFLVFTCDVESIPLTPRAKETKNEFSEEKNAKGKVSFKGRKIPDGLASLAVDIGIRHVGFATLARWHAKEKRIELLRARNIRIDSPETGEPTLRAFNRHKRELRWRRSQRGNPIKGESSHVLLQQHVDHMAEDRFKKAARAIVNLALNTAGDIDRKTGKPVPRADVLIIEDLGSLKPDATFERGVNNSIVAFNHGHLVDRIKELADDVGLKVFKTRPWATSQVCHRCGSLGRRYSIRREELENDKKRQPVIRFGATEPLFACPKCSSDNGAGRPFTCNADFNAAFNHQRCFYFPNALDDYGDKASRDQRISETERYLEPKLRELHRLANPFSDAPW